MGDEVRIKKVGSGESALSDMAVPPSPSPSFDQFRIDKDETEARVYRVVLTGGPCAGKTSLQPKLDARLSALGFLVYRVPEAATLLQQGGLSFVGLDADQVVDMQAHLLRMQRFLEDSFAEVGRTAARGSTTPVVLLCDRGLMDGKAYVESEEAWSEVLRRAGIGAGTPEDESSIRDTRYDAVLHLVTAADGAEAFYTTANNATRHETPAQARDVDRRTRAAWFGSPAWSIVGNEVTFETKAANALAIVSKALGIPAPLKKRFFLVRAGHDSDAAEELLERIKRADAKEAAADGDGDKDSSGTPAPWREYEIVHVYLREPGSEGGVGYWAGNGGADPAAALGVAPEDTVTEIRLTARRALTPIGGGVDPGVSAHLPPPAHPKTPMPAKSSGASVPASHSVVGGKTVSSPRFGPAGAAHPLPPPPSMPGLSLGDELETPPLPSPAVGLASVIDPSLGVSPGTPLADLPRGPDGRLLAATSSGLARGPVSYLLRARRLLKPGVTPARTPAGRPITAPGTTTTTASSSSSSSSSASAPPPATSSPPSDSAAAGGGGGLAGGRGVGIELGGDLLQEQSRFLAAREFAVMLTRRHPEKSHVLKRRRVFWYKSRVIEWDEVVEPKEYAGLRLVAVEVAEDAADAPPSALLPPELEVVREVTGEEAFHSEALAAGTGPSTE